MAYEDYTIPVNRVRFLERVKAVRLIMNYIDKNGYAPTDEEISSFYGLTEDEKTRFKKIFYSIDATKDYPWSEGDIRYFTKEMVLATYDITDTTTDKQLLWTGVKKNEGQDTSIVFTINSIDRMTIDGHEVTPVSRYRFDTIGKHTIGILLEDITDMTQISFANTSVKSIVIPECVTKIAYNQQNCGFNYCNDLTEIVCKAQTPPQYYSKINVRNYTLQLNGPLLSNEGILRVPDPEAYINAWFDKTSSQNSYTAESMKSAKWQAVEL